jgi:hypothetical protein
MLAKPFGEFGKILSFLRRISLHSGSPSHDSCFSGARTNMLDTLAQVNLDDPTYTAQLRATRLRGAGWSGVGLLLLGDYYRRYKNKLWMPRRPVLAGTAALSLGIVAYLGWIGLSQTFNRCGKLENQNSHYASSNRKVVQPTATKH